MSAAWRLVDTGPLDGPANMAVDEALLEAFDPERSDPVLRLYGWSPPAISVGRFQRPADVLDLARCRAGGVPVVRRITGGGAIFHADELTYSLVCAPRHLPPAPTVRDSFRHLTAFLLAFYRGLGIDAAWAADSVPEGARLGERTALCFAGKEAFDVLSGGRKIGGNAQRRRRGAIFQHGSVPLRDRAAEGVGYLLGSSVPPRLEAASLGSLGVELPPDVLKGRLASAFAGSLGAELRPSALSAAEREACETLRRAKYSEWAWEGAAS